MKANVTNIQALARGKATREQLQQESMPFRVERIVNAMDLDDSGTVHLTELAQFSLSGSSVVQVAAA